MSQYEACQQTRCQNRQRMFMSSMEEFDVLCTPDIAQFDQPVKQSRLLKEKADPEHLSIRNPTASPFRQRPPGHNRSVTPGFI